MLTALLDSIRAELVQCEEKQPASQKHNPPATVDLKAYADCLKILLDCLPVVTDPATTATLQKSYQHMVSSWRSASVPSFEATPLLQRELNAAQEAMQLMRAVSPAHDAYLTALHQHPEEAEESFLVAGAAHPSEELRALGERWARCCKERAVVTELLQSGSVQSSIRLVSMSLSFLTLY